MAMPSAPVVRKVSNTRRYGCFNRNLQPGYYVPVRVIDVNTGMFRVGTEYIANTMSRDCRYDLKTTDQTCTDCKHR